MASDTATIRVSRTTRDLLAEQAAARGLSVAALLSEIARQEHQAGLLHSEREANRRDREDPTIAEEENVWDDAVGDGID